MKPLRRPISNPSEWKDRHRLNIAIMRRGAESGTDQLSTWANYTFNTYIGGSNMFRPVSSTSFSETSKFLNEHAQAEKSRFIGKFGMDAEQLMELTGVAQAVYNDADGPGGALMQMFDAKDARPTGPEVREAFGDFEEIRKRGEMLDTELERYKSAIVDFSSRYQDILDVASNIDKAIGEKALNRINGSPVDIGNIPEGTPKTVRFDQTTLTSALNLQNRVDGLESVMNILDERASNIGGRVTGLRKGGAVTVPKHSPSGKGENRVYKETKTGVKLDRMHLAVQGHLTNYIGGVFEMGMALSIAEAANEIVEAVSVEGGGTGNAKLKLPAGGTWQLGKSKTDVSVKTKDFDINISNKAQRYRGGTDPTKALDTSITKVLEFLTTKKEDYATLQSGFFNPEARKPSSELNQFLGALIADYAVGGPSGDRIDFMAYQDTMVALYEYLPNISSAYIDTPSARVGKYQDWIEQYASATAKMGANYKIDTFRSSAKIIVKTNG